MTSDTIIPNWLDEKFIEDALREGDKNKTITVKQISARPATSAGDNYGSVMFRITAEYDTNSGISNEVYTKSLIVKALPDEEKAKKFITESGAFTTETEILRKLIPSFHRLLNNSSEKHVNLSAKYYYHTDKPHQKLVLEDLCESGFKMAQNRGGLDLDHSILVLSHLGMFHAASVALHRQDPHSFDNFLKHPLFETSETMGTILQYTFGMVAKDLDANIRSGQNYSEKLRKLGRNALNHLRTAVQRNEEKFNVLNHGDVWKNNIMFKYDGDGSVSDMTFVDFQYSYYGSPVLDLQYFLYSSPSSEVRRSHFNQLLDCYHSSLLKTLSILGCSEQCPSLDDILEEIENRSFMGVYAAVSIMPLTLLNADHVPDLSNIITNKPEESRSHVTGEFRDAIFELLPMFDKKGYLD